MSAKADLAIRGAVVISDGAYARDILISEGRVSALVEAGASEAKREIDARGLLAVQPVRGHPVAVEAARLMMLRFRWDSLRRVDHILVHDVRTRDLDRRPMVVALVDSNSPRRDIAARHPDGADAGRFVRPGLHPGTGEADWWRGAAAA